MQQYIPTYAELLGQYVKAIKNGGQPDAEKFVVAFVELLNGMDVEDFHYEGLGSYYGRVCRVIPGGCFGTNDPLVCLEITYDHDKIAVYTAYHNGYMVVPYLEVERGDKLFDEVYEELDRFLHKCFGLQHCGGV